VDQLEREPIPVRTALLAVLASSFLRVGWVTLVLIMPRTTTGYVLFGIVFVSAGVALLHWSLSWFGWTVPLRAALAARGLPVLLVGVAASVGFHPSALTLLALAAAEIVFGAWIVVVAAVRPTGWIGAGRDSKRLAPLAAAQADPHKRYEEGMAGLVRAARAARAERFGRAA
jgi:hypothetical protein